MKTGSFTPGAEGYEVYLTAFIPGAVSWARRVAGSSKTENRKAKHTGSLSFKTITFQFLFGINDNKY
jgi:hypothetical protein